MNLIVEKIYSDALLPTRAYEGDAGADIFAYVEVVIPAQERKDIATGIKLHIPEGHVGLIWDKSSLAFKNGIKTMGGVIDSGYRGELKVCLYNTTTEDFVIRRGMKIAQLILQPFASIPIAEGKVETETERGEKGFGSSS